MKKGLIITIAFVIVIIIGGCIYYYLIAKPRKNPPIENLMNKVLEGKKIAQIIAFRDFRDEEYFIPHNIFLSSGAFVKTYSTSLGTAIGSNGGEAKIDGIIDNLNVADFDAVVFSGGAGCLKYLDNEKSYELVKEVLKNNRILGSICISPVILARSGVLQGKKATVWHSTMDKSAVKILRENGAEFVDQSVVVDGNIVTGNGPGAAKEFAETIISLLTNK